MQGWDVWLEQFLIKGGSSKHTGGKAFPLGLQTQRVTVLYYSALL